MSPKQQFGSILVMTVCAQESDRESNDPSDAQRIEEAKIDCGMVMGKHDLILPKRKRPLPAKRREAVHFDK